jgi:hypothetical protein
MGRLFRRPIGISWMCDSVGNRGVPLSVTDILLLKNSATPPQRRHASGLRFPLAPTKRNSLKAFASRLAHL